MELVSTEARVGPCSAEGTAGANEENVSPAGDVHVLDTVRPFPFKIIAALGFLPNGLDLA